MARVKLLSPTDERRFLGRYEVIGEIAAGGMATVHLARLAGVGGFQRFVAIKQLHRHLANEEEFVEMFLDEARLAAGIHHPNVVPILEVGESEHGYYLVMEYIEGDTLGRLFARAASSATPVPYAISLRILLDALQGLHAAHELTDNGDQPLNIVHRDCSPQNVLVGVDGLSRLTDFGVARASSRIANTRSDTLKGKLAYMSPEQAKALPVDRRSDLFSMGVILWESLAGRRLLKAESEAGTLAKIIMEPLPTLLETVPGIHPAFDFVVMQALARDPAKRFQTAQEMADAVESAAREAASSSVTDVGVASPREVATFVGSLMGKDISAQRESVRAWVAQSEPSAVVPRDRISRTSAIPHTPKGGFGAPGSDRSAARQDSDPDDLRTTGKRGNALRVAAGAATAAADEQDARATQQQRKLQGPTLASEGAPTAAEVMAAAGMDIPVVTARAGALGADDDAPGRVNGMHDGVPQIVGPVAVPKALPLPARSRDFAPQSERAPAPAARWPLVLLVILLVGGAGFGGWWFGLRNAAQERPARKTDGAETADKPRGADPPPPPPPTTTAVAATSEPAGTAAEPASTGPKPKKPPKGPAPPPATGAPTGKPIAPPPTVDPDQTNPYK